MLACLRDRDHRRCLPFPTAYTKQPDERPFGNTGHPAELHAQTRTNNHNAEWWREQLGTLDNELAQAEWALALWSIATGPVVSELLPTLETCSASFLNHAASY